MTCNYVNTNIRKLYFECQETILNQFNIDTKNRATINSVSYLMLPVDGNNYTRNITDTTGKQDTFSSASITPKLVTVSFTVNVEDQQWKMKRCLSYLAKSSISSSYTTFIPVTCLDYVRPEIEDDIMTSRKGILNVESGGGTSGTDGTGKPLYVTPYSITFTEIEKRLVM
jgi:hypothetical protein